MFGLKHKVAGAARKAGLITASAALTCVGAAFLTAAAWIYLSAAHSPSFAALIIGLVYLGAGVVVLAMAVSRPPPPPPPQDPLGGLSPMQLILVSFLRGLEQGQNAKGPK
ncbi:phage holin family protein [Pseudorhodobacter sp. W20_MBD10_FR17]|uniref:phage holin family protein n=1 Tax=Pseudorhodobacter sp. W20_MBD10_FR17 TaxID=3240266 RepID=UPI003F995395